MVCWIVGLLLLPLAALGFLFCLAVYEKPRRWFPR